MTRDLFGDIDDIDEGVDGLAGRIAALTPPPDRYRVSFTVPGVAVGKLRPRVTKHGTFTPAKTRRYESLVRAAGVAAMGRLRPCRDSVQMSLVVFLPVPASWSRTKRNAAIAGLLHPIVRPDLDNFEKSIADALIGVVYRDDAQICDVVKSKRYALQPRVVVEFNSIGGFSAYELQPQRTRHAHAAPHG